MFPRYLKTRFNSVAQPHLDQNIRTPTELYNALASKSSERRFCVCIVPLRMQNGNVSHWTVGIETVGPPTSDKSITIGHQVVLFQTERSEAVQLFYVDPVDRITQMSQAATAQYWWAVQARYSRETCFTYTKRSIASISSASFTDKSFSWNELKNNSKLVVFL